MSRRTDVARLTLQAASRPPFGCVGLASDDSKGYRAAKRFSLLVHAQPDTAGIHRQNPRPFVSQHDV
jgi:hypothetical protein